MSHSVHESFQRDKEKVVSLNATVEDTISLIIDHINESISQPELRTLAQYASENFSDEFGKCKWISNFALKSAYYEPDPPDRQRVKTAYATLRDQRGNCVDYSILISAVLLLNNVRHLLRLVELESGKGFAHIYPVAILQNGKELALDIVPQQDQNGKERLIRPVGTSAKIGEEIARSSQMDFKIL